MRLPSIWYVHDAWSSMCWQRTKYNIRLWSGKFNGVIGLGDKVTHEYLGSLAAFMYASFRIQVKEVGGTFFMLVFTWEIQNLATNSAYNMEIIQLFRKFKSSKTTYCAHSLLAKYLDHKHNFQYCAKSYFLCPCKIKISVWMSYKKLSSQPE